MNQDELYEIFKDFRIPRDDKAYPPYHSGQYLEEFFVENFRKESPRSEHFLIPVHWTAVFNYRSKEGLGPGTPNANLRQSLFETIKNLPSINQSYFTVSTHDDAPQGEFPFATKHFYAGGNSNLGTDPIPLVCAPLPNVPDYQKLIFCSFVGSATNPIRNHSLQYFSKKEGYMVNAFHWRPDVTQDQLSLFIDVTSRSRFTLCPRGYGATSYRLYEAMQLMSIPIYISDNHILPWSDVLDWNKICIVSENLPDYNTLDHYIKNLTETQIREMQDKIKEIYPLYFTIPAVYNQIIKRI